MRERKKRDEGERGREKNRIKSIAVWFYSIGKYFQF